MKQPISKLISVSLSHFARNGKFDVLIFQLLFASLAAFSEIARFNFPFSFFLDSLSLVLVKRCKAAIRPKSDFSFPLGVIEELQ